MEVLGIDIGGTGIKAAPVDIERGCLLAERRRLPTPQPATPEAVSKVVTALVKEFSWQGPLGCGFPSVVRDGVALTAANIDPAWIGVDVATLLASASGCPVCLINDADAAGLAEMRFGAGRGVYGTVLLITIGTGLGSALFRGGQLVPNTEFGHLFLENGQMAERFASARVRKQQGLSWPEWASRFSMYLQQLERLVRPDLFILGGGSSRNHEKFSRLLEIKTPVRIARLFNEAGIVGAALAAGAAESGRSGHLPGGGTGGIIQ